MLHLHTLAVRFRPSRVTRGGNQIGSRGAGASEDEDGSRGSNRSGTEDESGNEGGNGNEDGSGGSNRSGTEDGNGASCGSDNEVGNERARAGRRFLRSPSSGVSGRVAPGPGRPS